MRKLTDIELANISDIFDVLESEALYIDGFGRLSGGFANAEIIDYDDKVIDVELKYGVQSDCENRVYTETYQINRETMEVIK